MNVYLTSMYEAYKKGRYLETNFQLFCQQAEMTEILAFNFFLEKGIKFLFKPNFFKIKGKMKYSPSGNMIVLFKNLEIA